jgi:hypothetical protein
MKRLVTKVNCFIFFGEELCNKPCLSFVLCIDENGPCTNGRLHKIADNTEFTTAALEFPQAVIFAAELLRITPGFMKPLVASMATSRHRAAKMLYQYLVPIVEQRLVARDLQPNEPVPVRRDGCPQTCNPASLLFGQDCIKTDIGTI